MTGPTVSSSSSSSPRVMTTSVSFARIIDANCLSQLVFLSSLLGWAHATFWFALSVEQQLRLEELAFPPIELPI